MLVTIITIAVAIIASSLVYINTVTLHRTDIQSLEDEVITSLYGASIHSAWKSIPVTLNNNTSSEYWMTHYLKPTNSTYDREKPDVLLLHGYGATSAFTWRLTIPALLDKFNVYAIDMPGFGRTVAPESLMNTDMQATHDAYCEFYQSAISSIGIRQPLVIAHSFGGFVFTQCAAQHPEMLSKLVLVSVPGIFPSNGGWDYLWSNYFYMGLPQNGLKLIGDWAHLIYDTAVYLTDSQWKYHVIRYWHLYHTDEIAMQSDFMVRKFIKHYGYYSIGRATSLVPLLRASARVPVMTIYGTKDIIVPFQQGELIQSISFNAIKTHVIEGANHVTYVHNGGHEFAEVVNNFYASNAHRSMETLDQAIKATERVAECLEVYNDDWNTYPCVPSYFLSNRLQQQMYASIRNIVQFKCGLNVPLP